MGDEDEDVAVDHSHDGDGGDFVNKIFTGRSGDRPIDHGVPPCPFTLKFQEPLNGWDFIDATCFNVRGKSYLTDKKKFPSRPSGFQLCEFTGFALSEKCKFSSERPDSYYNRSRAVGRKNFVFVMHFDLNPVHAALCFELNDDTMRNDPGFATCWSRFLQGDDAYKSKRIKLITSVVEASWFVRKVLGKPVPALIGNKLKCHWRQTDDLLECTCDVASSIAAATILQVVRSYCKHIVCDLVLLIEGQEEDELPERIIGGARVLHHDMREYVWADKS